jgi:hypothetical protein
MASVIGNPLPQPTLPPGKYRPPHITCDLGFFTLLDKIQLEWTPVRDAGRDAGYLRITSWDDHNGYVVAFAGKLHTLKQLLMDITEQLNQNL